jgi:transposase
LGDRAGLRKGGFLAHRNEEGVKMSQKSAKPPSTSERLVRGMRRATGKYYSAEEKIRIVVDGLRGEASVAENMYYSWSKGFLEAGKRRLAGDTARGRPATR